MTVLRSAFFSGLFCVLVLCVAQAQTPPTGVYTVRTGDTLAGVARLFETTEARLRLLNSLSSDSLAAGQALRIPLDAPAPGAAWEKAHRVQPGETLAAIAARYGLDAAALRARNALGAGDVRPGQSVALGVFLRFDAAPPGAPADTSQVDTAEAVAALEQLMENQFLDLSSRSNTGITAALRTSLSSSKQAPATVVTLSDEQLRARGYTSLGDVLMDLPDFKIERFADEEVRDVVTVRGLRGQDKFVILLDGVRISSPTNEFMPILDNYPVHLAKQIEVVYGPASAVYGADAVAGVINIVSKEVHDLSRPLQLALEGTTYRRVGASALAGTNLAEGINLVVAGRFMHDARPNLSRFYERDFPGLSSLQTGTFDTSFGPMTPAEAVADDYRLPVTTYALYGILRVSDFQLSYFQNRARVPSSITNPPFNAVYNDDVFYAKELSVVSGNYTKQLDDLSLTTLLTLSHYEEDPASNYRNLFTGLERGHKYAYGSMQKLEQLAAWWASDRLTVSGGATFERFNAVPKGTDLEQPVQTDQSIGGIILGTRIDSLGLRGVPAAFFNLTFHNFGVFVQSEVQAARALTLTLGLRGDRNSRFGTTVHPRLGLVWRPSEPFVFKALYGTAFLAPAPRWAYEHFGSFRYDVDRKTYVSPFWQLPNPDLGPIRARTAELNALYYVTKNLGVTLTGYLADYAGLFRIVPDAGNTNLYDGAFRGFEVDHIEVPINQGRQRNYGLTASLQYLTVLGLDRKLEVAAALSYLDGRVDEEDAAGTTREIPVISPFSAKAVATLSLPAWVFTARLVAYGAQRAPALRADDETARQTIPGYALLNLNGRYRWTEHLDVTWAVENALDLRYHAVGRHTRPDAPDDRSNFEFPAGLPQDPRRITLGLTVRF